MKILYNSSFVPRELIRSFGAEPVSLQAETVPDLDTSSGQVLRFMDPYHRSMLSCLIRLKEPDTPCIFALTDCHSVRMAEMAEEFITAVHRVAVPPGYGSAGSLGYYRNELLNTVHFLEKTTGRRFNEEALRRETVKENSLRAKLSSAGEIWLNPSAGSLRLAVAGRVALDNKDPVIRTIQACGGEITAMMTDEKPFLCEGEVRTDGDMIDNLAQCYYCREFPPEFYLGSWDRRFRIIEESMKKSGAKGIVWYQLSFDEVYDLEGRLMAETMAHKGIPFLRVETSYDETADELAGMETRIESFIAMLRWNDGCI